MSVASDLPLWKEEYPLYHDESLSISSFLGVFVTRLRKGIKEFECFNETRLRYLVLSLFCKLWVYFSDGNNYCSLVDTQGHIGADWAVLYLQDVICDKLYQEHVYGKFPYQESTVNKWFTKQNEPEGQNETPRTVNMLNWNKVPKSRYPLLKGSVFQPPEGSEEGYTILCHGTSHESAAIIFEEGIRLSKLDARRDQDFSCGKGFYLASFHEAKKWAFCQYPSAVLLFRMPNEIIDRFRPRSINLVGEERREEWKRVINNVEEEIKGKSFIEGPWIHRLRNAVKTDEQKEGSYQMCIFDKELVEQFDRNLHSIVFYK